MMRPLAGHVSNSHTEFRCLFTSQKQKKTKTWQDGYLRLYDKNAKIVLYNDKRAVLDSTFNKGGMLQVGDDLDMDRHLVTVEENLGYVQDSGQNAVPAGRFAMMPPPTSQTTPAPVSAPPMPTPVAPSTSRLSSIPRPQATFSSTSAVVVPSAATRPLFSAPPRAFVQPQTQVPIAYPTPTPNSTPPPPVIQQQSHQPRSSEVLQVNQRPAGMKWPKWRAPIANVNLVAQQANEDPLGNFETEMKYMDEYPSEPTISTVKTTTPVSASPVAPSRAHAQTSGYTSAPSMVAIAAGPRLNPTIATVTPCIVKASHVSDAPENPEPPKRRKIGLSKASSTSRTSANGKGSTRIKIQKIPKKTLEFPSAARCQTLTNSYSQDLKRTLTLHSRFGSLMKYQEGMNHLIIEHLQILVIQIASSYWKLKTGGKIKSDDEYRSKGIAVYSECSLRRRGDPYPGLPLFMDQQKGGGGGFGISKYGNSNNLSNFTPASTAAAEQGVVINMSSREHHSKYSMGDLWVICPTTNFEPTTTFFARSVFYGPSGGSEIELTCLSSKDSAVARTLLPNVTTVFAIRALNANSEFMMLDHLPLLPQISLLPTVLNHISAEDLEKSSTNIFRPPSRVPEKSGCIVFTNEDGLDIERELQRISLKFKLNDDQTEILYRFALMVIRAPGWGTGRKEQETPILLVHGVFGAGKSFLIAVLIIFIDHLMKLARPLSEEERPWRIMISSFTNVAVDRVLLALLDLGYSQFVRVGSLKSISKRILPFTVQKSHGKVGEDVKELQSILEDDSLSIKERVYVKEAMKRFQKSSNRDLLVGAKVVATTCYSSTTETLEGISFPIMILDEASQLMEPMSMIPICRALSDKVVMVGDPLQLSPTIQTPADKEAVKSGLGRTLFDRAIEMGIKPVKLRIQYRCHPKLAEICNQLFYGNDLHTGITAQDREPMIERLPTLSFVDIKNGTEEQNWRSKSFTNVEEAKIVVGIIQSLLRLNIPASEMGVIAFYKAQADLIASMLKQQAVASGTKAGVKISTVDAFQGAEMNIIIVSTVRTKSIGFADDSQRVNVALSRAKRHLFVAGNLGLLDSNPVWGSVINDHCRHSTTGDGVVEGQRFVGWLSTMTPLEKVDEREVLDESEDEEEDEEEVEEVEEEEEAEMSKGIYRDSNYSKAATKKLEASRRYAMYTADEDENEGMLIEGKEEEEEEDDLVGNGRFQTAETAKKTFTAVNFRSLKPPSSSPVQPLAGASTRFSKNNHVLNEQQDLVTTTDALPNDRSRTTARLLFGTKGRREPPPSPFGLPRLTNQAIPSLSAPAKMTEAEILLEQQLEMQEAERFARETGRRVEDDEDLMVEEMDHRDNQQAKENEVEEGEEEAEEEAEQMHDDGFENFDDKGDLWDEDKEEIDTNASKVDCLNINTESGNNNYNINVKRVLEERQVTDEEIWSMSAEDDDDGVPEEELKEEKEEEEKENVEWQEQQQHGLEFKADRLESSVREQELDKESASQQVSITLPPTIQSQLLSRPQVQQQPPPQQQQQQQQQLQEQHGSGMFSQDWNDPLATLELSGFVSQSPRSAVPGLTTPISSTSTLGSTNVILTTSPRVLQAQSRSPSSSQPRRTGSKLSSQIENGQQHQDEEVDDLACLEMDDLF